MPLSKLDWSPPPSFAGCGRPAPSLLRCCVGTSPAASRTRQGHRTRWPVVLNVLRVPSNVLRVPSIGDFHITARRHRHTSHSDVGSTAKIDCRRARGDVENPIQSRKDVQALWIQCRETPRRWSSLGAQWRGEPDVTRSIASPCRVKPSEAHIESIGGTATAHTLPVVSSRWLAQPGSGAAHTSPVVRAAHTLPVVRCPLHWTW